MLAFRPALLLAALLAATSAQAQLFPSFERNTVPADQPTPAKADEYALPDPGMTPGAVDVPQEVFCHRRAVRHLPPGLSAEVARAYNVPPTDIGVRYQLDHLVPLSISGSTNAKNLWPQPMAQAYVKDRLDAKMKRLICAGKLTLRQAVEEMSGDWTESYVKRIGPLPALR